MELVIANGAMAVATSAKASIMATGGMTLIAYAAVASAVMWFALVVWPAIQEARTVAAAITYYPRVIGSWSYENGRYVSMYWALYSAPAGERNGVIVDMTTNVT